MVESCSERSAILSNKAAFDFDAIMTGVIVPNMVYLTPPVAAYFT